MAQNNLCQLQAFKSPRRNDVTDNDPPRADVNAYGRVNGGTKFDRYGDATGEAAAARQQAEQEDEEEEAMIHQLVLQSTIDGRRSEKRAFDSLGGGLVLDPLDRRSGDRASAEYRRRPNRGFDTLGGGLIPVRRSGGAWMTPDEAASSSSDVEGPFNVVPRDFDSLGGGIIPDKRASFDSLGGGLIPHKRGFDSLGGGLIPAKKRETGRNGMGGRYPDWFGNSQFAARRETSPKRNSFDTLGGGLIPYKRGFDTLGGGLIPTKKDLNEPLGDDLFRQNELKGGQNSELSATKKDIKVPLGNDFFRQNELKGGQNYEN